MSKDTTFVYNDVFPSYWPNSIGEFLSTQAANFRLTQYNDTTVEVLADTDDDQVCIGIKGLMRWNDTTVQAAHPGGAAGTYPVFVTCADNDIDSTPDPYTDNTVRSFDLTIEAIGDTPTIVPGTVDQYRQVGTVQWNGSKITKVYQSVGVTPPSDESLDIGNLDSGLVNAISVGLQEGVVSNNLTPFTRVNANTLRVAAGSAWINGDNVVGSGLYRVSWAQTDITIPSTGANKRVDRIVIPAVLGDGVTTPTRVAGSENGTVDHDSLQGAASIPAGYLQVATVIASTSGISSTNDSDDGIRDRRPWAQGFFYEHDRTGNGVGGDDYTTSSGSNVLIDSNNLNYRMECSGKPVRMCLRGTFEISSANQGILFRPAVDGVAFGSTSNYLHYFPSANQTRILNIEIPFTPSAGSHKLGLLWSVTGGTGKLHAGLGYKLSFSLEEIVRIPDYNEM